MQLGCQIKTAKKLKIMGFGGEVMFQFEICIKIRNDS